MSEWRELKTLQEVAAAQAAGEEIVHNAPSGWFQWEGLTWFDNVKYRARPKTETVTLRKALFRGKDGDLWSYECNEAYAKAFGFVFVCWLGDPVTYEVEE